MAISKLFDIKAEERLLALLYSNPDSLLETYHIEPQFFYSERNRQLYRAMREYDFSNTSDHEHFANLLANNYDVDIEKSLLVLESKAKSRNANVLHELMEYIRLLYLKRSLSKSLRKIADTFEYSECDEIELINSFDKAEYELFEAAEKFNSPCPEGDLLNHEIHEVYRSIDQRRINSKKTPAKTMLFNAGQPYAFVNDNKVERLFFLIKLLLESSLEEDNRPIILFSQKLGHEELLKRLVFESAGIPYHSTQPISNSDWVKLSASMGDIVDQSIYLNDTTEFSIPRIRAYCRHMKKEGEELGLIVVQEPDTVNLRHLILSLESVSVYLDTPMIIISNRETELNNLSKHLTFIGQNP